MNKMRNKSLYHWLVVACCCGLMAVTLGISYNCSGVFYSPVAESLGVGTGDVQLYMTIMSLVAAFTAPLSGKLVNRINLFLWIVVGAVFVFLPLLSWSFVTAIWQMYIASVFHGLGNCMLGAVVVNQIINNWFSKKNGLVMGIVFSFSGITGAILSPVFQSIINATGWKTAHIIAAVFGLVVISPSIFILKLKPAQKGLLPYLYEEKTDEKTSVSHSEAISQKSLYLVIAVIIITFSAGFITGLGQNLKDYAVGVGFTAETGALLISAVMIGNMSSKLLFGILSDKIGPRFTMIVWEALIVAGLATLLTLTSMGFTAMVAGAYFLGYSYSVGGTGMSQLTRVYFSDAERTKYYAWATTAGTLGSSFASAAIGYLYQFTGSYTASLILCAVLAAVCFVLALGIKKKTA